MSFFKKLFGTKTREESGPNRDFTQEEYETDDELKQLGLETILGKMHNIVGHAIIPFQVGGAVDMYYFPSHIPGTGFATMELLNPNGKGPKPNRNGTYELVAFTKEEYVQSEDGAIPFNLIERRICGVFTALGQYSSQAVFNINETCEVPRGEENVCIIFDKYQPGNSEFKVGDRTHHLLLCLEVFRNELLFARENGSALLLEKLKQRGHYPYSDLNREPVV
jgi:hypothetical protein